MCIIPRERLTDGADWRNRSELNEHGHVAWGCECSAWNDLGLVRCWRCDRERLRRAPYQSLSDMVAAMNRAAVNHGGSSRASLPEVRGWNPSVRRWKQIAVLATMILACDGSGAATSLGPETDAGDASAAETAPSPPKRGAGLNADVSSDSGRGAAVERDAGPSDGGPRSMASDASARDSQIWADGADALVTASPADAKPEAGPDAPLGCRVRSSMSTCPDPAQTCMPLDEKRPVHGICCACGDTKNCLQIGDSCGDPNVYCTSYRVGNIHTVQSQCVLRGCEGLPEGNLCFGIDGVGTCMAGKCVVTCLHKDLCVK